MHSHKCPKIRVSTYVLVLLYLVLFCITLYCLVLSCIARKASTWMTCPMQSDLGAKVRVVSARKLMHPAYGVALKGTARINIQGLRPILVLNVHNIRSQSLTQAAQAFFFRPSWELCTSDNFASIFHEDSWSIPGNYAWPFHEGKDSTRHNCFSELSRADSHCTSHNSFWFCHGGSFRIQRNFVWLCHADKVCILHTWTWWIFRVGSQYIWNSSTWPCHENSRCIQYIAFWLSHVGKADKFDTCPFEKHRADSAQLASQSLLLWHSWPHSHQPFVPGAYTNASGHRLYSVLKQALEISGANALKLVRLV